MEKRKKKGREKQDGRREVSDSSFESNGTQGIATSCVYAAKAIPTDEKSAPRQSILEYRWIRTHIVRWYHRIPTAAWWHASHITTSLNLSESLGVIRSFPFDAFYPEKEVLMPSQSSEASDTHI